MRLKMIGICLIVFSILMPWTVLAEKSIVKENAPARIEGITCESPSDVLIRLSRKTGYEVIRIDEKQILIAFKGTVKASDLKAELNRDGIVANISCDQLKGAISAVVLYTKHSITTVAPRWQNESSDLLIRLAS